MKKFLIIILVLGSIGFYAFHHYHEKNAKVVSIQGLKFKNNGTGELAQGTATQTFYQLQTPNTYSNKATKEAMTALLSYTAGQNSLNLKGYSAYIPLINSYPYIGRAPSASENGAFGSEKMTSSLVDCTKAVDKYFNYVINTTSSMLVPDKQKELQTAVQELNSTGLDNYVNYFMNAYMSQATKNGYTPTDLQISNYKTALKCEAKLSFINYLTQDGGYVDPINLNIVQNLFSNSNLHNSTFTPQIGNNSENNQYINN